MSVHRNPVGPQIIVADGHENAFHASVGRRFRAKQHADLASGSAAERRRQRDVLVGAVEDQPPTCRFRRRHDFARFRTPFRLSNGSPPRESGAIEGDVRHKVFRGPVHRRHFEQRDRERRREQKDQTSTA
jgi:hypothetical protein